MTLSASRKQTWGSTWAALSWLNDRNLLVLYQVHKPGNKGKSSEFSFPWMHLFSISMITHFCNLREQFLELQATHEMKYNFTQYSTGMFLEVQNVFILLNRRQLQVKGRPSSMGNSTVTALMRNGKPKRCNLTWEQRVLQQEQRIDQNTLFGWCTSITEVFHNVLTGGCLSIVGKLTLSQKKTKKTRPDTFSLKKVDLWLLHGVNKMCVSGHWEFCILVELENMQFWTWL